MASNSNPHVFDREEPDRAVQLALDDLVLRWEPGEFVHGILPTQLEHVRFDRSVVAAGGQAGLEVSTLFVADGSPLEVELATEDGRRLATITESRLGTPLQVHRNRARATVPPSVTKEAAGLRLMATAVLPEQGRRLPAARALRVGPRVAVRSVTFLKETERTTVEAVRAGGPPVRIQAQLDVHPPDGLAEGTKATVRLYRMDHRDGRGAHVPIGDPIRTTVKGPPGKQGVEVFWQPTMEQVGQRSGAEASRKVFWSQRELEKWGATYDAPRVFAEVEVWGASGTSLDEGSRGGSGPLAVRDEVEIVHRIGNAPAAGRRYVAYLPDGTKREGMLDDEGRAVLDDVPPGRVHYELLPNA